MLRADEKGKEAGKRARLRDESRGVAISYTNEGKEKEVGVFAAIIFSKAYRM
jgi:hypothetical protein